MSASQVLLAGHGQEDQWLSDNPDRTYFEVNYKKPNNFMAYSYEVPFEQSAVYYNDSAVCTIPAKGDLVKRFTVRSVLPTLYQPLGPGYVYPLYTDQVNGTVYIPDGTIAIQPGDFIGYFNTQFQAAWATNFAGYSNINVTYDSSLIKFVFTSTVYAHIYFQDDMSGVFWGFDPRSFDFITSGGYKAYRFVNNTITAPFTLFQAGWIRGFTPPPGVGFSYVDSVACRLVKSATLLIGGQTIDTLTSERLIIEDDLGVSYENQTGLAILEGKGDASQVYAPREYYTRLTFNTDKINKKALYDQDLQVEIEYEKFENLPQTLIPTKSLTDGGSYVNTNIKTLLGIPDSKVTRHSAFYKKYVVLVTADPVLVNQTRYYFYDTTKPIGNPSSWVSWLDPQVATIRSVGRPYFIGGTMYTFGEGGGNIRSVPVADMLTGTAVPTIGSTYFPLYDLKPSTNGIVADARYLYIDVGVRSYTFGSNTAGLSSTTPNNSADGRGATPMFVSYKIASITTDNLIPSDNVALINFVTSNVLGCTSQFTPTLVSMFTQQKIGSDIFANVKVEYNSVLVVSSVPQVYINTTHLLSASNTATFISCKSFLEAQGPDCAYANTIAVYKVFNIATPQLIPSDNAAVINFLTTYAVTFPGTTRTISIVSQVKTDSNILVTSNVAYTYTSNGKPAFNVMYIPFGYQGSVNNRNAMVVRYDSTKSVTSSSSYDYLANASGGPVTWYEITGLFSLSFAPMPMTTDGRYIISTVQGSSVLTKIDQLNFLSLSSYTYFNVGTLPIVPNTGGIPGGQVPNASDGRYFYFQTSAFSGGSAYLTRYDTTQDITSPSAYSFILFTSSKFLNGVSLFPYGFDGKSVYYITGTYSTMFATILRYDTTTNTVSDWIIFDGTGKAQTSKGTTVDTITWMGKGWTNNVPTTSLLSCLVSSRYVYITEASPGGFESTTDLVQFDPLVMDGGTLQSSMIIKYETYDKPKPLRSQSLYGQTTVNEFTLLQGQSTGSFKLDVRGPVREFWVTMDSPGVIKRVVFKLNNEILVDDDQVMTRYIRTFETHTSMPSSSNVCVYSVSWDPERLVPSGTVNMSRVADQTLDVTLVSAAPSNLKVRVYAKVFNVLAIQGGIGNLMYN